MAVIPGATISFTDYLAPGTPRVLNVPAAHGDASAQEIWDTLSEEAAKLENLIYKKLLDRPKGGGKATIGVGKATGITVPMSNVQVQFEPQVIKVSTGSVTTADAAGETLIDSLATFITDGVARGDLVLNTADASHSTVLRILSETSLVATPLLGGTDNQYDLTDGYEILDQVRRAITDGDVIAFDHLEATLNPILTAFGIDSTVELSTSPALSISSGVPTRGEALPNFSFLMVSSSDHISDATALTVTAQVQKDDGAFAAATNSVVEIGLGYYRIDLTATEMDADKILLRFSATGADNRGVEIFTG